MELGRFCCVWRAGDTDPVVAGQRCVQLVLQLWLVHRLGAGRDYLLRVVRDAFTAFGRENSGVNEGPIAGKPAPTGIESYTNCVFTQEPVGAGLPAIAVYQTPQRHP
ncbi:hypothetical protein EMIT0P395_10252 [Pseudomonas sp. IT-P395]